MRKVQTFYCRVPTFWGDEGLWAPPDTSLMSLGEGEISDWPPEWRPFVRLLRSEKPVPKPLPLHVLPSEWRKRAEETAACRRERDLALAKFIDDRMPEGRKRQGVPNNLIIDAKPKFRLKSKSAILRAYKRGKERKEMTEAILRVYKRGQEWNETKALVRAYQRGEMTEEEYGRKLSWEELEDLKLQLQRDGSAI